MRRHYTILAMFILTYIYYTVTPVYARISQGEITPIEVQEIYMSPSLQYAIELIAKTTQGVRKFIIQESIPRDIEKYITKEDIALVCKQLMHEIQQGMIDVMWIEQIYALIEGPQRRKDAVRFKYLFISRLQENLPPDFIDSSHTIADAYGIPHSYNIESPIMAVPAIPEYSDTLLTQEINEHDDTTQVALYDDYSAQQQAQAFIDEQENINLAIEDKPTSYTTEMIPTEQPETTHNAKKSEHKTILTQKAQQSDMQVMYQSTLENIADWNKQKVYKKYNNLQKVFESNQ